MVDNAIKEKKRLLKKWKAGGSKESYLEAKWQDGKKASLEDYAAEKGGREISEYFEKRL